MYGQCMGTGKGGYLGSVGPVLDLFGFLNLFLFFFAPCGMGSTDMVVSVWTFSKRWDKWHRAHSTLPSLVRGVWDRWQSVRYDFLGGCYGLGGGSAAMWD